MLIPRCTLPRVTVMEDPLSPEEHLKLGLAYEERGDYENAIKEYRDVGEKLPLSCLFLANIYFVKKNYRMAEEQYKIAIREMPENPRPYNNLAWLYKSEGTNLDEAEALARRAVELASEEEKAAYLDTLEKILKANSLKDKAPSGLKR
jgi:tetratricopeptide (TPR) repeat protein